MYRSRIVFPVLPLFRWAAIERHRNPLARKPTTRASSSAVHALLFLFGLAAYKEKSEYLEHELLIFKTNPCPSGTYFGPPFCPFRVAAFSQHLRLAFVTDFHRTIDVFQRVATLTQSEHTQGSLVATTLHVMIIDFDIVRTGAFHWMMPFQVFFGVTLPKGLLRKYDHLRVCVLVDV